MPRFRGVRGIVLFLTVGLMATALLGGCASKADADAQARLDASISALRDTSAKLKALEPAIQEFVAAAPGLKGDEFATRHAEVIAAIDTAAAAAATTRTEAEAAKAVQGVGNEIIPQAADFLVGMADSTDKVLQSTRKMMDEDLGTPAKFGPAYRELVTNRVVFQTLLIGKQATFTSEGADRISKVLGT